MALVLTTLDAHDVDPEPVEMRLARLDVARSVTTGMQAGQAIPDA